MNKSSKINLVILFVFLVLAIVGVLFGIPYVKRQRAQLEDQQKVRELAQLLHTFCADNQRFPKNVNELAEFAAGAYPKEMGGILIERLEDGEFVLVDEISEFTSETDKVLLFYHKNCKTKGGAVAYQSTLTDYLTPKEFKQAMEFTLSQAKAQTTETIQSAKQHIPEHLVDSANYLKVLEGYSKAPLRSLSQQILLAVKKAMEKRERDKVSINGNFLDSTNNDKVPDGIVGLFEFEEVYLQNLVIDELPDVFVEFKKMKTLEVFNTGIRTIPESMLKLPRLESMTFANSQLQNFPSDIVDLPQLKFLDLNNNKLEKLPDDFGVGMQKITGMFLSRNELTELPQEFGNRFPNLKGANFHTNKLSRLPESFGNLSKLNYLDFDRNSFESFPTELCNIPRLARVVFGSNQIASLPPEIKNMKTLLRLELDSNRLTSLPAEIGQLENIRALILDGNRISELPKELSNNKKMVILSLDRNPIGDEQVSVILSCKQLETCNLRSTSLSEQGQQKLRSGLPNCKFSF